MAASTTTAAKVGIVACATSSSGAVTNAMDVVTWQQSCNDIDNNNNNNNQCQWRPSAHPPRTTTSWHGNFWWYRIPLSRCRGILGAGIGGGGGKGQWAMTMTTSTTGEGRDNKPGLGEDGVSLTRQARQAMTATLASRLSLLSN